VSDVEELRAALDALLDRARAAGLLPELCAGLASAAREAAAPPERAQEAPGRFGMVGDSPPMRRMFDLIERVRASDVPVLIHGETGTGKELVAHALHEHGPRRRKPFLAENCAAVSPTLLESELFGHVKGAFTDAHADRAGHFVAADGGTVFLDEIGDMPLEMQSKLLRVLQEGEVRPVGANKVRKVDVRVVGATNKDLREMVAARTFREDLYYRLAVVSLELPPLREREGDVRLLIQALAPRLAEDVGRPLPPFEPDALAALEAYPWPGNVRELENELRRTFALCGDRVGLADLSPAVRAVVK
jgi:transcriptional regulator with GAF, ATPase, and Fis domain